jgi:putative peptide zinc metalloprotease protein
MDYLEIAELWERSFDYVSSWIKKTIFRLPVDLESPPRKVRAIFFAYCLTSVAYKIVLLVAVLGFLRYVFVGMLGDLGYPALALAVIVALRKWLLDLGGFLRFAILDKKEFLMKPRTLVAAGSISVVLLAVFLLLPFSVTVRGPFTLEAGSVAVVKAPVAGTVQEVLVHEGSTVREGDSLAILRDDGLARGMAVLSSRRMLIDQEIADASQRGDRALLAKKAHERTLVLGQVEALRKDLDALTLRSPGTGIVTTPRLADLRGAYLRPGQTFCTVADAGSLVARVTVREPLLEEIASGQRVELKTVAYPLETLAGSVLAVAPFSNTGDQGGSPAGLEEPLPGRDHTYFDVIVAIDEEFSGLREGMAGRARIHVGRFTPAVRIWRGFDRWFRSRVW